METTSSEQLRPPKRRSAHPVRKGITIAALAATASAAGAGAFAAIEALNNHPMSRAQRDEIELLEKMRTNEKPVKVLNGVLIVRNANYRKTPSTVLPVAGDTTAPQPGNVAGKVEKDKAIVVTRPIIVNTDNGYDVRSGDPVQETWYGFRLSTDENSGVQDGKGLAGDMVWVNATELEGQHDEQGTPDLVIYRDTANTGIDEAKGTIDSGGNFYLIGQAGQKTPAAQATIMEADSAVFLLNSLNTNPDNK